MESVVRGRGDGFGPEMFQDRSGALAWLALGIKAFVNFGRSGYQVGRAWRSTGSSVEPKKARERWVAEGASEAVPTKTAGYREWTRDHLASAAFLPPGFWCWGSLRSPQPTGLTSDF